MTQPQERNIAVAFRNIHNIITRGLKVSIDGIHDASRHGFRDGASREGLFKYIQALTSVLNAHHLTEDELAFPYFRVLLPQALFDRLAEDHRRIVEVMDGIRRAAAQCEAENGLPSVLADLEAALTTLGQLWHPHIRVETDEFISKADALVSGEEQRRLTKQFSEHGQKLSVPPYLTVPFLLYNLPAEDRMVFTQDMPAELLEHLVPVVWRAQWEPMAPYLLT